MLFWSDKRATSTWSADLADCGVVVSQTNVGARGTGHLIKARLFLEGDVSDLQICGCDRPMRHGSRYCFAATVVVPDAAIAFGQWCMRGPQLYYEVSHGSLMDLYREKINDASVE